MFPDLHSKLLTRNPPAPRLKLQIEVFAEIHAPHLGIIAELLGTTVAEDLAVIDDIGAVRYRQRLANIMIGHQNPEAGVLKIENEPLQLQNLNRIDARKWLIQ